MPYNVDMMLSVRNAIAAHPDQHNQGVWSSHPDSNPFDDCGTTACIAGWTLAVNGETVQGYRRRMWGSENYPGSVTVHAAELLGLNEGEACRLFLDTMNNDAALALLDEYIAKGKNGE